MPTPTFATPLTTLQPQLRSFFEFEYDRSQFIGARVLPEMPVPKSAGTFGKVPIEELLKQTDNLKRNSRAGYSRDRSQFTEDNYQCVEYGYEELIDDRDRNLYSSFLDAEGFATQRAVNQLLTAQELRVASAVFDTSAFNTTAWAAPTLDDPTATARRQIEDASQAVYDQCGMWPNAVICNRKVFRELRLNNGVTEAIASAGAGDQVRSTDVTVAQMQEVFDVDMVLVAGGAQNTANVNQQAAISQLWANHIMLAKVAVTQDIREPCIGRGFHWAEDGSSFLGTMEMYREDQTRGNVARIRHEVHEKIIYTEAGHILANAL